MHTTGIIGLGIMGRRMLEHMGLHSEFQVTAMWDPDPAACRAASAIAPETPISACAQDVIAAADVIYIACPPAARKAYAVAAATALKSVFLEKPLGIDLADSQDLVFNLNNYGVKGFVNYTQAAGEALYTVQNRSDLGTLMGIDIVVTYPQWPRAWQADADWLRYAAEGGFTREVISHFIFFASSVLGPLEFLWSKVEYPEGSDLCETHVAARLENVDGVPVSIFGSVGGAQPDRQEITVKGSKESWRISEFYQLWRSDGGPFERVDQDPPDPRAVSLKAQLDDLDRALRGEPYRLATPSAALSVQYLVEKILTRSQPE